MTDEEDKRKRLEEKRARDRERKRKSRALFPEKEKATKARYLAKPEKAEANRERVREWRKKHPEKSRDAVKKYQRSHPEWVRAKVKKFREEHPEWYREMSRRNGRLYYQRRALAEGRFTDRLFWDKVAEQKGRCFYCRKSLRHTAATCDHKIPLSRGGTNLPENVCACCRKCNERKGNKTPEEYFSYLESLDDA